MSKSIPSSRTSYARGLEEGAYEFEQQASCASRACGVGEGLSAEARERIARLLLEATVSLLRKANRALRGTRNA